MIDRLSDDHRVQLAAIIGYQFKIDPLIVLKTDLFDWSVRVAASQYIDHLREKAQQQQKK